MRLWLCRSAVLGHLGLVQELLELPASVMGDQAVLAVQAAQSLSAPSVPVAMVHLQHTTAMAPQVVMVVPQEIQAAQEIQATLEHSATLVLLELDALLAVQETQE
jgi:hypothetical protein